MFDEDFDEYCIAAGLVEVCCGAGTLRGCRRPGAENWARVSLTLSLTTHVTGADGGHRPPPAGGAPPFAHAEQRRQRGPRAGARAGAWQVLDTHWIPC